MILTLWYALIGLASLVLAMGASYEFSWQGVAAGSVAVLLAAYPFWQRERDRLYDAAELKYRGHAIASSRAMVVATKEIASEFASTAERAGYQIAEGRMRAIIGQQQDAGRTDRLAAPAWPTTDRAARQTVTIDG